MLANLKYIALVLTLSLCFAVVIETNPTTAPGEKIEVQIEGANLTVRKGTTNLTLNIYGFAEVTNKTSSCAVYELGVLYPGGCYSSSSDYATGSYNSTFATKCIIPGPINENMTLDVYAFGWLSSTCQRPISNDFSIDKDTVQIVIKQ